MNESLTRTSRLRATYRSFVPSTATDTSSFVWTATLLVSLLVGVVPLVSLTTELTAPTLVVAAGVGYGIVIVLARAGFEGLASAAVVLAVFDLGITLVEGPGSIPVSSLSVMAVDVVAIPLFVLFAYSAGTRWSLDSIDRSAETVAVAALAAFLGWAMLSGLVANGQSSFAPLLDTTQYLRYGLLFVLAALIVRATNPWCVIYPLVIAIGGNLAVALAQVANGGGFGLRSLGETPTVILGTFALAGRQVPFGSYAGGFVGHSREFTIILLLFVPLLLAVMARRSWGSRLGALVATGGAVLVVRTADTDAGWAALALTGVLCAATFGYAALYDRHRRVAAGVLAAGVTTVLAAVTLVVRVVLRASAETAPTIPLFDTRSLAIRIEQYQVAVSIARTHPLFGLGTGNVYLMSETLGLSTLRGIHGIVFSYLATTGVVGAGAYVLGVTAVLVVCVRRYFRAAGREQLLWGALACGMVGFHAYSLWDLAHLWDAALSILWLAMGVVVGARAR